MTRGSLDVAMIRPQLPAGIVTFWTMWSPRFPLEQDERKAGFGKVRVKLNGRDWVGNRPADCGCSDPQPDVPELLSVTQLRSLVNITAKAAWGGEFPIAARFPKKMAIWEGPKSNSGAPTIAYFADGTSNTSNVEVAVAQTCPLSLCSVASVKAARRPMEISRPVARIVPLVLLRPFTNETFNSSVV